MNEVRFLATGQKFIKEGVRGTEPVIEELIKDAEKEIQILAYVISQHAKKMLELLENALSRGVRVTLVINNFQSQEREIRDRLSSLSREFEHMKVVSFEDQDGGELHAKVLVMDRKKAVIGSANFSWHGMKKNYEVGVIVEGESVWKLAKLIDDLVLD